MKKRIIIGLLMFVVVVLITGVAVAVNPIRIFVNGQEIYSDVAPFIKDGRTMVPLRVISEALGADVDWDSGTQIVSVAAVNKNIDTMKFYSRVAEQYRRLDVLGEGIINLSRGLYLVYDGIKIKNDIDYLNTVNDRASKIIDAYNESLTPVNDMILEAQNMGLDVSDMNLILNDYYNAIDYYKEASSALYDYYYSNSTKDFDGYLSNSSKLDDNAYAGQSKTIPGYFKYYNMVQRY